MILDARLSQSVVYDYCFFNCVEGLGVHHEVTDAFTEFSDLNTYVSKERIYEPSPDDHYCFRI